MAIGVAAQLPAVAAPEQIGGGPVPGIERREVIFPLLRIAPSFQPDGLHSLRPCLLKLFLSHRTQKFRCVAAMGEPALLLPSGKARRAKGDLIHDRSVYRFPRTAANGVSVNKLGLEPGMCGAIGNAPRTHRLRLFLAVDGPLIDKPFPLPADFTDRV